MVGDHLRLVIDIVAIAAVEHWPPAHLAGAIEELPAQPVVILPPRRPPGKRVVQRDDAGALLQQRGKAFAQLLRRFEVFGHAAIVIEIEARHVVEHQHIEPAHPIGVHQPRSGRLIDHRRRNAFDRLEHRVEAGAIEGMAAYRHKALDRGVVFDDRHRVRALPRPCRYSRRSASRDRLRARFRAPRFRKSAWSACRHRATRAAAA